MEVVYKKIKLRIIIRNSKHLHCLWNIKNCNISSYPTLENCLFEVVTWSKNVDIDSYKYFGYGIGFNRHGLFSHPSGGTGRNVIIFGVDTSLSTKVNNREKIFEFLLNVLHKD